VGSRTRCRAAACPALLAGPQRDCPGCGAHAPRACSLRIGNISHPQPERSALLPRSETGSGHALEGSRKSAIAIACQQLRAIGAPPGRATSSEAPEKPVRPVAARVVGGHRVSSAAERPLQPALRGSRPGKGRFQLPRAAFKVVHHRPWWMAVVVKSPSVVASIAALAPALA